jgi:DNA gyrase/topoisomerase IV subunit B
MTLHGGFTDSGYRGRRTGRVFRNGLGDSRIGLASDDGAVLLDAAEKIEHGLRQRFKGLGEMNPAHLRETTMNPDTRRLVKFSLEPAEYTHHSLGLLLAKKRAADRRVWLEAKGNLA